MGASLVGGADLPIFATSLAFRPRGELTHLSSFLLSGRAIDRDRQRFPQELRSIPGEQWGESPTGSPGPDCMQ
jgi:hypothetical protein